MFPCIVNERNDLVPKTNNILYLISTTDNYNVFTNPHLDIDTNLSLLVSVLEQCKNKDITFNFASSWFVYGPTNSSEPLTEDSPCNPRGFYSITKRTAEELLISYCNTFNIKYRILRYANVVGSGDKKVSEKRNVLSHVIRQIKRNDPVRLVNNGLFYRDYIHVEDICSATNLIMTKGEFNTIYNVGNEKLVSFREAVEYAIQKTNSKSELQLVSPAEIGAKAPESCAINCTKLRNLGFVPKYDLYNIIDDIINEEI